MVPKPSRLGFFLIVTRHQIKAPAELSPMAGAEFRTCSAEEP
jgi:hypothetical protein